MPLNASIILSLDDALSWFVSRLNPPTTPTMMDNAAAILNSAPTTLFICFALKYLNIFIALARFFIVAPSASIPMLMATILAIIFALSSPETSLFARAFMAATNPIRVTTTMPSAMAACFGSSILLSI